MSSDMMKLVELLRTLSVAGADSFAFSASAAFSSSVLVGVALTSSLVGCAFLIASASVELTSSVTVLEVSIELSVAIGFWFPASATAGAVVSCVTAILTLLSASVTTYVMSLIGVVAFSVTTSVT